jgi:histidyl-tRNA synthetase
MTVQLPKGTRDFYPEDQRIQNHIFDTWRKACLRFAYEEYEGPMFEHLELYTGKSGDEIVKQLYNFIDKGGRDIALRPEMTPTLARLVIQKGGTLKMPFKWFSIPRLFRYERTQKGRLREFFQLNMDIIGSDSVYAEADLLVGICSMLRDFGLKPADFVIGISSRKLLSTFLTELKATDPTAVYPVLDRRAKIPGDIFLAELAAAGLAAEQVVRLDAFMACKSIDEVKACIQSQDSQAALQELEDLFTILAHAGVSESVALDLAVVRGLAYYTGIVFEVFDRGHSMRAVAGGGRYDSLTERLGGKKVPCVGFGMGDVVLADLLSDRGLLPTTGPTVDFYLVTFAGNMPKLFEVAASLRNAGCSCSHALAPAKVGKQMESANIAGASRVIFVDGDKAPPGEYEFKNLKDGTQGCSTLDQLIKEVQP